jgi:hypothetical protein
MSKATIHVVPHEEAWALKREGNERVTSTHDTQKIAIDAARDLAKEGDEIVIHRPDGTIREHTTYTPTNASQNGDAAGSESRVSARDTVSVGTRINWGAILAGVIVALAVYVTLNLFAIAIGISSIDQMRGSNVVMWSAVVSSLCMFVALFLGGFVASIGTVGEEKGEAMSYGVLVWAVMLLLLVGSGFSMQIGHFAGVRDLGYAENATLATPVQTPQQPIIGTLTPQGLGWWVFGGVVISLISAVGGGLAGAGPDTVLRRFRGSQNTVVVQRA